jgi:hypothetical protein
VTVINADKVTVAEADFVVSACEVAITVTSDGLGTVGGAVYKPPVVIVPQVAPAHPTPLTLQVTPVFAVPVTVAWNCFCAPVTSCALVGEMVIPISVPEPRVTVAEADLLASASKVAVTVTIGGLGAKAGAVYRPLPVTVPQVMPLQPAPETLHNTRVLEVPVTVALNGTCPPSLTWVEVGEMVTVTAAPRPTVAVPD